MATIITARSTFQIINYYVKNNVIMFIITDHTHYQST